MGAKSARMTTVETIDEFVVGSASRSPRSQEEKNNELNTRIGDLFFDSHSGNE